MTLGAVARAMGSALLLAGAAAHAAEVMVKSPNGAIRLALLVHKDGRLGSPDRHGGRVQFTSPVMIYAANPKSLLENPAVEVIKSIPTVWDETLVLPGSGIGEAAAFARRSGDRWFLGVLNGPTARTLKVDLSFLAKGSYRATLVRDKGEGGAALEIEQREVARKDILELALRAGGGFVARFSR